jgi:pimeloyl-ACP methyl ester carboxylesterase
LRVRVAQLSAAPLVSFRGAGHLPNVRDPARFKLLLLDFVDRVAA